MKLESTFYSLRSIIGEGLRRQQSAEITEIDNQLHAFRDILYAGYPLYTPPSYFIVDSPQTLPYTLLLT